MYLYQRSLTTVSEENIKCSIEVLVSTPKNINNSRAPSVESGPFYSPTYHAKTKLFDLEIQMLFKLEFTAMSFSHLISSP